MAENTFQFDELETGAPESETAAEANIPEREVLLSKSALFKMLGDITRLKILYAIKERELNVQEIADAVAVSQSAVSHQLRLLRSHGIVDFKKAGRMTFYFISADEISSLL